MKTNKTIVVLGVLLLVLITAKWIQDKQNNQPIDIPGYKAYWAQVSPAGISAFQIIQLESTLSFQRQDGLKWKVNDYDADLTQVNSLLDKIIAPKEIQLIAENPAQHPGLGISSSSAVISIPNDQGNKQVTLGNDTVGGTYIKLEGSDFVYLVSALPNQNRMSDLSAWVDPVIARFNQSELAKLNIISGKDQLLLSKVESKWMYDGKEVNMTAINPLLMTLESFATKGLLSEQEVSKLPKNPSTTLKIERDNQEPVTVNFYEIKDLAAVSIESKPGVYGISQESLKNFKPDKSELLNSGN